MNIEFRVPNATSTKALGAKQTTLDQTSPCNGPSCSLSSPSTSFPEVLNEWNKKWPKTRQQKEQSICRERITKCGVAPSAFRGGGKGCWGVLLQWALTLTRTSPCAARTDDPRQPSNAPNT